MEEALAELADVVLLVVESPGTFAELGAFAISEPLRRKLLPILDARHLGQESFLETGPVRWVDADSDFAPSIWTNLDRILEAATDVDKRLDRISDDGSPRIADLSASPKHLVFFVCDLVTVFGPCATDQVIALLNQILPDADTGRVPLFLELGVAMRILRAFEIDGVRVYFQPLDHGKLRSFHRTKKFIDLPTLRAQVVGAMQGIRSGRNALRLMADHDGSA
jgi:hypothetical protein